MNKNLRSLLSGADTLVFSYVDYLPREEPVTEEKGDQDDVVAATYGQKKESMASSITAINPKELKGPASNLTTMLAGRISGLISYQRSGEPGADNAAFFIRGISSFDSGKLDPLILIDGMESGGTEQACMLPDDIAGFSVLYPVDEIEGQNTERTVHSF